MNVQVFLQSELLRDIEVVEVDAKAGYPALLRACLAKVGNDGAGMALFIEDDDDAGAAEKINHIPDGLRVHLHRQKEIEVTVRYAATAATGNAPVSASVPVLIADLLLAGTGVRYPTSSSLALRLT